MPNPIVDMLIGRSRNVLPIGQAPADLRQAVNEMPTTIDADLKNIFRKASPAVDVDEDENVPVPINGVRTVYPDATPAPTIGDKCNLVRMVAELGPIRYDEIMKEVGELDVRRAVLNIEASTIAALLETLDNGKEKS